jgi:hypothetical protein
LDEDDDEQDQQSEDGGEHYCLCGDHIFTFVFLCESFVGKDWRIRKLFEASNK